MGGLFFSAYLLIRPFRGRRRPGGRVGGHLLLIVSGGVSTAK